MPSRWDETIRRWDVVRWLRRQAKDVHLTETGQARISCTHCSDRKYRLYINRKTHAWMCFNCPGKGRSAITYVKWVLKTEDDDQAMKAIIQSSDGLHLRDWSDEDEYEAPRERPQRGVQETPLPIGFRELKLPATERSQEYWDYLINRSITPTMVQRYKMGFCRNGKYKGRIIIPISVFGVRRGFVGRTIYEVETKKKYLNDAGVHTGQLLFNLDQVVANGSDKVVLVEGVFDALRIPEVGVCTFGKKISNHQISLLTQAGFRKWVFCYDGDAAEDSAHYGSMVPSYVQCFRAELPGKYDPGNAPMADLSRAIRDAKYWNLASVGV